jgi:hypothetical protein
VETVVTGTSCAAIALSSAFKPLMLLLA